MAGSMGAGCDLPECATRGRMASLRGQRGLATGLARVALLGLMARPCRGAFTVTQGNCGTSTNAGLPCFTSPNYPSDYGPYENCAISAPADLAEVYSSRRGSNFKVSNPGATARGGRV